MKDETFRRLFEIVHRFRRALVTLVLVVAAAGAWQAASLQLDMSFRPLFADDPAALERTREFEDVFGQRSGAHIGVVLASEDISTESFRRRLHALSEAVRGLDHVAAVHSATHLPRTLDNDEVRAAVLSADGRHTVLWARLGVPLADLAARRPVVREFRELVRSHLPPRTKAHFVGISVVESAYADIVLRCLVISVALTSLVIVGVLFAFVGSIASVLVAMAGTCLAIPFTLGAMHVLGQQMTIVNSMVPTMILVIGVGDAIHMLNAFRGGRRGMTVYGAGREMFARTGNACLFTTLTTSVGFLSLQLAHLGAIRDFGLAVCIGVFAVYAMNLVLMPALLGWVSRCASARGHRWLDALARRSSRLVVGHPRATAAALGALALGVVAAVPCLTVEQRFNNAVASDHPIRAGQALLESEFGGILGPEIDIRRVDGGSLLTPATVRKIGTWRRRIDGHALVTSTASYADFLSGSEASRWSATVRRLRDDPDVGWEVGSLISPANDRAALVVRTVDMGTDAATGFVDWLEETGAAELGPDFVVAVVGQWWLAQRGMTHLLDDLLSSFVAACLAVLPLMALVVRRWRLFVIGLVANVLPMAFALGFMALTGITLRIGTAMILAIALGIAIDDTIHFMCRLRDESEEKPPPAAVRTAILGTGRAVLLTTIILVAGFGSMVTSELLDLRDMGIVGSVTLVAALLADVFLAPALFLLIAARPPKSLGQTSGSTRSTRYAAAPAVPHTTGRP